VFMLSDPFRFKAGSFCWREVQKLFMRGCKKIVIFLAGVPKGNTFTPSLMTWKELSVISRAFV